MKTRTPEEGISALTDDAERNRLLAEMAEQSTDMISRHTRTIGASSMPHLLLLIYWVTESKKLLVCLLTIFTILMM